MINEFGAAPACRPIEHRAPVQANHINASRFLRQKLPHGAARTFLVTNSLAGILDHPLAMRNRFLCEHTNPLDARTADAEPKTSKIRVDARNVILGGHVNRANYSEDASPASETCIPEV